MTSKNIFLPAFLPHWSFPEIFRNPPVEETIFRSHTPPEILSHFSPPPGIPHHFFSHPLEFHGNPLSSIMTPWYFPFLNITPSNFPDCHFQDPLEFPLSLEGIRKISGKAHSKGTLLLLLLLLINIFSCLHNKHGSSYSESV